MKKFIFLVAISFPVISSAAEVDMAIVKRLMIDRSYGEKVFIHLDKRQSPTISCHTISSWEYILDISDALGKSMYSSILTLYASGKPSKFVGTDSCSLNSEIETLNRVELK